MVVGGAPIPSCLGTGWRWGSKDKAGAAVLAGGSLPSRCPHAWWPLGALSPAAPHTLLTLSVDTLHSFKASIFMNWSFLLLFIYQFFARELPFLGRRICPLGTCFVLLRDYIDVFVPLFTDVL